jgi:hypothetical protein
MSHGLDQYIANQLTREHVIEVIADPARADAIFTDRLGEPLEIKLEKLHPTPRTEEDEADNDSEKDDSDAKDAANNKDTEAARKPPEPEATHTSTFGRGKGTLFLVDTHSRLILWSIYEKPTMSNPNSLDGVARRVVSRLKQDLAGK